MEILHIRTLNLTKRLAHSEKYFSKDQSVEDLPGSLMHQISQSFHRIIEEIAKIAGKPVHIYIGSTQGEDEKKLESVLQNVMKTLRKML